MSLQTCAVRIRVNKQDGTADEGALVVAKLNRFDIDGSDGYVGPIEVEGETDADGLVVLDLWPNELGATESMYTIRIEGSGQPLTVSAAIPDTATVNLEDVANVPAYPGRGPGDAAAANAAASAAAAAASAVEADDSADAAAASAAAADASADAAAVSAAAADASADAAAASLSTMNSTLAAAVASATAAAEAAADEAEDSATDAAASAAEAAQTAAELAATLNPSVTMYSGTGSQTAFTLASDPGSKNNTRVHIGGVYQFRSSYEVGGTTLTFNVAPPAGTNNIEIEIGTVAQVELGVTAASAITFSPTGNIAATNTQSAIAELDTEKASLTQLAAGGGAALVGNTPAGNIAAVTVQAALNELDTEKVALSALAASTGSNLSGHTASGTGAVAVIVGNELRKFVWADGYGAVLDGLTDDTAAVQRAIDYLDSLGTGGTVLIPATARIYIAGTLTVKRGITLSGGRRHSVITQSVGDYYAMGSQIKLGASGKIVLQRGAGLVRTLVIRAGLYTTVPVNAAQAAAVVAAFTGVAIEATSADDIFVTECMLLGHTTAVSATTCSRVVISDVYIDATNGVYINGAVDICRLRGVHCWPFLTAFVTGVGNTPNDPAPNRRSGYGFKLDTLCDWSTLMDCFAYGYARNYWLSSTSNVSLVRCSADYTNPNTGSVAGFVVDGTSTYTTITGGTAIATAQGVLVDTTGGALSDSAVKITGTTFANTAECIQVNNGNVNALGCSFQSGTYAASFAAGADKSSVNSCEFDGVTADFYFASESVKRLVTRIGNTWQDTAPSSAPERIPHDMTVQKSGVILSLLDTAAVAGGAGATLKMEQEFAAGTQDAVKIKANLVSGTAGNEAVSLDFGVNRSGTVTYRARLHHDGHWVPVTDNAVDLGQSSARWRNAYATTYRVGDGTAFWQSGNGSPEGVVTAVRGSIYSRLDGGAGTSFYVKESGTGNTGWVAK